MKSTNYLATFTIVGTQLVEIQPYQPDVPQIPWAFIVVVCIAATTLLVVVLFKAGFIYSDTEQDEETPKKESVVRKQEPENVMLLTYHKKSRALRLLPFFNFGRFFL